ncbi:MAG: hypothetical protein ACKOX6_11255 [Bdellovibrio sp.]
MIMPSKATEKLASKWIITDKLDRKLGISHRIIGNPEGKHLALWTALEPDKTYSWKIMFHENYDDVPVCLLSGGNCNSMSDAQERAENALNFFVFQNLL